MLRTASQPAQPPSQAAPGPSQVSALRACHTQDPHLPLTSITASASSSTPTSASSPSTRSCQPMQMPANCIALRSSLCTAHRPYPGSPCYLPTNCTMFLSRQSRRIRPCAVQSQELLHAAAAPNVAARPGRLLPGCTLSQRCQQRRQQKERGSATAPTTSCCPHHPAHLRRHRHHPATTTPSRRTSCSTDSSWWGSFRMPTSTLTATTWTWS